MQYNKDRNAYKRPRKIDSEKAKLLCYASLYPDYDDERLLKVANTKYMAYKPFLNYISLALKAAQSKQSIGAKFVIVDRDKDYRLSCWINVKIISKIINCKVINDQEFIDKAIEFGMPVEDIEVKSIKVNGEDVIFHQLQDSIVFEAEKNSRIMVNNDPDILFDRNEYSSNTVNYYGNTMICRKQKISIENYLGDECCDSTFTFIKYKIHRDTDDENPDEFTIELIDDPTSEISVYEIFFNEDQNDVYFNPETKQRYKVTYKNKEQGRLVIKSPNGLDEIDINGKVYLNTNTNQLNRQRVAINSIIERPSPFQKVLLNLCEKRQYSPLEKFNYYENEIEYKILKDVTREGTLKQREFVKKALQTPDFMILQGPPGSGKTTAILELIYQLALRGKKVLLCASTHVAIDNVLEKIIENKDSRELLSLINPVRVGDENNVYSDCVKDYVYSNIHNNVANSDYERLINESFNLVCGTTIGVLNFPLIDRQVNDIDADGKRSTARTTIEPIFDYLILDEASKTTFSEFLVPATLCKQWIIVGDVKQLAPYVEKNDLIPSLLQCKPLAVKDERFALSFLKLYLNHKDREKYKDYGFIFNTAAIEYIDNRVEIGNNLIAVTNSNNLKNIFTINHDDLVKNTYKTAALASYGQMILIEEGLVDEVLPLLNSKVILLHNEKDLRSIIYYHKYSILHARERFDSNYKKIYKDYSRKIEDEILWRLIRMYELNNAQATSQKYNKYIEDIKSLLKSESLDEFNKTIDTLKNIAIPSIIMMLQEGISKDTQFQTILNSGLSNEDKINRFVMLDYQHRMHKDISKVSRQYVYDNEALKDSAKWKSKMNYINDKSRFEVRNIIGPVVDGNNKNEFEAEAVMNELKQFMEYAKNHKKEDGSIYTVAILAFYNGQVVLLRKQLKELFNQPRSNFNYYGDNIHVTLNTVDKFQGQEADVVYLTMVQNFRVGFLDSINRVNVAITRAKEKIVIFGDKKFFVSQDNSELLKKVFKEA